VHAQHPVQQLHTVQCVAGVVDSLRVRARTQRQTRGLAHHYRMSMTWSVAEQLMAAGLPSMRAGADDFTILYPCAITQPGMPRISAASCWE